MQQLSIATFGTTPQDPGVVHAGLKLKDGGNQYLQPITVPSICELLTAQPISLCLEKFEHLKQLNLAGYSNGQDPLQVDILIGADYYWELVTGRTSRCEDKSFGIKQPDQCVLTEFEEKIELKNGRYQVLLPWKDIHPPSPDNYQLALKCL